jgi:hypothetical protein
VFPLSPHVEFGLHHVSMKGDPVMRTVLVMLTMALSIASAPLPAAAQCNRPAVTVRIHDYVHLQSESLSTAADIVTRVYKSVGVGIEWLGFAQMDVGGKPTPDGSKAPVAQLTINILTQAMAARGGVPQNVVGFVAVPPEGGMGRIGYVVYEHVPQIAAASQTSEGEILAVIVAHDIRRLILGVGADGNDGIEGGKARRDDPMSLEFTPAEVAKLRATLERNSEAGHCNPA